MMLGIMVNIVPKSNDHSMMTDKSEKEEDLVHLKRKKQQVDIIIEIIVDITLMIMVHQVKKIYMNHRKRKDQIQISPFHLPCGILNNATQKDVQERNWRE
jgi:hypothetical protein